MRVEDACDTETAADSSVRVLVVHGQENWQIAAESVEVWHTGK